MRRLVLVSLVATIAAVGLAAGEAGSASLPPALFVVGPTSNAPGNHEPLLTLLASTSDTLSAASMSIYVPNGYGLDLTLPKGTKVGGVVALPNFDASDLVVDDPAAFTADPCAPGTHAGVWTTSMTVSGRPTTVPIFLDPTTGTDTARGAYRLTYCQTSIALLVLETGLTAPTTPGAYTWRAFVQPPGVAPAAQDPNAVYELRSVVEIPHSLAAKARYDTRTHMLTISGKVLDANVPEARSAVSILQQKGSNIVPFARATTKADGTFTAKRRVVQTAAARTLTFESAAAKQPGACTEASLAPAGCLYQTYASSSPTIFKTRIPRLPPRPKKH